jgi:3-hydroxybutyryl-CoA dehydrogenase
MKSGDIKQVAVVGSGMIGASLAALFTGNGYRTTMCAISDAEAGLARYSRCYQDLIEKGLVTERQAEICRRCLSVTRDLADIAEADFIIECVVENLEIKHGVYGRIEAHCKRFKVIASTTSAISADDLCGGLKAKEKLIVAHPFNPPHLVPCVEIAPSAETAPETLKIAEDFFLSVGRDPIVMKKGAPGFVANRLQHALFRECVHLVESGVATPEMVDRALKSSFVPRYTAVGIFEHFDYAGLDMMCEVEEYLFPTLCDAKGAQDLIRKPYEAGDLGFKTGKGVYDWSKIDIEDFRKRSTAPYLRFFNWSLPAE